MKRTSKCNAGFTLIELVVAMAIAVVVTAAATTVLLMGLRINRQTGDTASRQMTVRQLLNVVQDAAADGSITNVKTDYDSWELVGSVQVEGENDPQERVIFSYDAETQTISTNGTTVLTGVYASNAILENGLLSISVETKEGIFVSSVYCRLNIQAEGPPVDQPDIEGNAGVEKFIAVLKSQYRSRGEIVYATGIQPSEYTYYSEWYIRGYETDSRWNEKTPWCACFVSWALNQAGMDGPSTNHSGWYANVDEFMAYFQDVNQTESAWKDSKAHSGTYEPNPGDLIFFDWNKGTNPQHIGVVLKVENNMVYTIEGNSAGRVTVRSYSIGDPRIIGYGILPWQSAENGTE